MSVRAREFRILPANDKTGAHTRDTPSCALGQCSDSYFGEHDYTSRPTSPPHSKRAARPGWNGEGTGVRALQLRDWLVLAWALVVAAQDSQRR